jgi:hypothetical protein
VQPVRRQWAQQRLGRTQVVVVRADEQGQLARRGGGRKAGDGAVEEPQPATTRRRGERDDPVVGQRRALDRERADGRLRSEGAVGAVPHRA